MEDKIHLSSSVIEEIRAGRKIDAIRTLREETGLDFKTATEIVLHELTSFRDSNLDDSLKVKSKNLSHLTSSSPLSQALREISNWIDTSQTSHAKIIRESKQLRAGLDQEKIDWYLKDMNFHLSLEVSELYQWHDGRVLLGDYANSIFFVQLKNAAKYLRNQSIYNGFSKLPLFIGDQVYFVVDSAINNQTFSEIYCFDGMGNSEFSINTKAYSPSITNLMQAVAECAKLYDGISPYFMVGDEQLKLGCSSDTVNGKQRFYKSLLSPIYERYGIKDFEGNGGALWH
ncbi:hypothetical protein ACSYAD_11590 [Acaryochloris marina NIES-2412]|uniref:hypothetical protein n=1 Tax=Acaryochloris marina TaxID=155978 RepID=UPI0040592AA6